MLVQILFAKELWNCAQNYPPPFICCKVLSLFFRDVCRFRFAVKVDEMGKKNLPKKKDEFDEIYTKK